MKRSACAAALAAIVMCWLAVPGASRDRPVCAAADLPLRVSAPDDDQQQKKPRRGKLRCGVPVGKNFDGMVSSCRAGGGSSPKLTDTAIARLVETGLFERAEFAGVRIRFCSTRRARGFAPDQRSIFLALHIAKDPFEVAALIAHEMVHIRQYRRIGDEEMRCAYAKASFSCNDCSSATHALEAPAYAMERRAREKLRAQARR